MVGLPADKAAGDVIRSADFDAVLAAVRLTLNNILTKTADYDIVDADSVILVDATGGHVKLTLPAATTAGKQYFLAKTDSSGNYVEIDAAGADKVDGLSKKFLVAQYDKLLIMADGVSKWAIVATVGAPH